MSIIHCSFVTRPLLEGVPSNGEVNKRFPLFLSSKNEVSLKVVSHLIMGGFCPCHNIPLIPSHSISVPFLIFKKCAISGLPSAASLNFLGFVHRVYSLTRKYKLNSSLELSRYIFSTHTWIKCIDNEADKVGKKLPNSSAQTGYDTR